MALKMRQSFAEFERDFHEEMRLDRHRRQELRKQAVARSRRRHREKRQKRSSLRFWILVLTLVLTAAAVTIGMFETLYALLG